MRLEIFDEPQGPKEQIVQLKLERIGESIFLITVDENGGSLWNLLEILPDGRFRKCSAVTEDSGFQVNRTNTIKEKK